MKKVLTTAFVMLLAVSTQAATITWHTGYLYVPVDRGNFTAPNSGTELAGSAPYTGVIQFFTSHANAVAGTPVYLTDTKGSYTAGLTHSLNGTTANVFDLSTAEAKVNYWARVVVTSPTTTVQGQEGNWVLTSNILTWEMPGGGNYIMKTVDVGGWANSGDWIFVPIPEPATMALLGIGVVALGLRRRRK